MLSRPIRINQQTINSIPFWSWPSALSLDAVLVAWLWQRFFAKSFSYSLYWQQQVILGLTVWLIYVLDRIIDSYKLDLNKPHSFRHAFYLKNRLMFIVLAALALVVDLYFICTALSYREIVFGIALFGFVLIYGLVGAWGGWARAYKELSIGVLFSFGVNLIMISQGIKLELILGIAIFAALATLNCLLISIWEADYDQAQGYQSAKNHKLNLDKYVSASLITLSLFSTLLYAIGFESFYLAILLSASTMYFLAKYNAYFSTEALRLLVDVALLSPLIMFAFS